MKKDVKFDFYKIYIKISFRKNLVDYFPTYINFTYNDYIKRYYSISTLIHKNYKLILKPLCTTFVKSETN